MKKRLTGLLAAFGCALMLAACGGTAPKAQEEIPEEVRTNLFSLTEQTVQQMEEVVAGQLVEEQKSYAVVYNGLKSWESAKAEIGAVDFAADADGNGIADCFTEKTIVTDDEGNYVVTIGVAGESRNADVVITYAKDISDYLNITTNVVYSFRELIEQAGMNTLLGMGTTFCVLILLSLIIAIFGAILTSSTRKKAAEEKKKAAVPVPSPEPSPAPVKKAPASEEEKRSEEDASGELVAVLTAASCAAQEDDGALAAVIAAAVAAYESETEAGAVPAADPDVFIARRIRRNRRR